MIAALVRPALAAFFPPLGDLPGAENGIRAYTDRFLEETSWMMWLGIVGSALLYQVCPLLTLYLPVPAVLLGDARRGQHAAVQRARQVEPEGGLGVPVRRHPEAQANQQSNTDLRVPESFTITDPEGVEPARATGRRFRRAGRRARVHFLHAAAPHA